MKISSEIVFFFKFRALRVGFAAISQKKPRVRKIRVRNSGTGNGCANFMDTWKNAFFLQEKPCP